MPVYLLDATDRFLGADSSFELIIYDVLCSPVAPTDSRSKKREEEEEEEEDDASAGVFTFGEVIMSMVTLSVLAMTITTTFKSNVKL